jgi:hypothetical protein
MTNEPYDPRRPFVSVSDIIYVDFVKKQVVAEQVLSFDKLELVREGLINYHRLIGHGTVRLVYDKAG